MRARIADTAEMQLHGADVHSQGRRNGLPRAGCEIFLRADRNPAGQRLDLKFGSRGIDHGMKRFDVRLHQNDVGVHRTADRVTPGHERMRRAGIQPGLN